MTHFPKAPKVVYFKREPCTSVWTLLLEFRMLIIEVTTPSTANSIRVIWGRSILSEANMKAAMLPCVGLPYFNMHPV